jgi:hypothetical protein
VSEIRQAIVISDLHCGCRLGLCPPGDIPLDDGGTYRASKLQHKVWLMWQNFWNIVVPEWTRGEPWGLIVNGDALEGNHHMSVTQISHNIGDQQNIAYECLKGPVGRAQAYYHVRGTEAHVGPSGQYEEQLARSLGAIPNEDGQYARWELWKRIGPSLVHFTHHIGATSSTAYESSALMREMSESLVEAARWGDEPPECIVRSHRHRAIEIRIPSGGGHVMGVVTPPWQLPTPYMYRRGMVKSPQIGGYLLRWKEGVGLYAAARVWRVERGAIE